MCVCRLPYADCLMHISNLVAIDHTSSLGDLFIAQGDTHVVLSIIHCKAQDTPGKDVWPRKGN